MKLPRAPRAASGSRPLLLLFVAGAAVPAAGEGPGLGSSLAAQQADPIRVRETRQTYEVTGGTAAEVWDSLRAGARREGEELIFAWTEVATDYRSRMLRNRDGCRIVGVDVELRIDVILPAWTPPSDAPRELRLRWNRYESAIRRHEEGHVRLARETGRRLRDALLGLTAHDCEALKTWGTEVGERVLERGRRDQERYDVETGYGRTQGVRWDVDPGGGRG